MKQLIKRVLKLATATTVVALYWPTAQAYYWDQANYSDTRTELPPWDNQGHRPQGASRGWEIERLQVDQDYRLLILDAYTTLLPDVIAWSKSEDGARQARRDVESQHVNYRRWAESTDRRREAIARGEGSLPVNAAFSSTDPLAQVGGDPEWAAADSAKQVAAGRASSFRYQ